MSKIIIKSVEKKSHVPEELQKETTIDFSEFTLKSIMEPVTTHVANCILTLVDHYKAKIGLH